MPEDKKKGNQGENQGKGGANREGGPVDVQKYLAGVDYPATKQDLIDIASDNNAPEEVIETLGGIDDMEYGSVADVSKAVAGK
jgi:hypothetical protein